MFSTINFGRETKPAIRKKLFLNIVTTKKLFQNFYKAIISNSAQFACKFKGLALLLYNVTTKAEMTHCSLQLYNESKNFYVKNQTQNSEIWLNVHQLRMSRLDPCQSQTLNLP